MTKPDGEGAFTGHGAGVARRRSCAQRGRQHCDRLGRADRSTSARCSPSKDRVEDVRDADVAAREGWRDRRPPRRRRAPAGDGQDALWLGQEDPDHAALASQVLRPVRQHPRLSVVAAVADEPARHRVSRRDRPDLLHGLELPRLRASAIWRASPPCSCAISTRPMSRPRRRACPRATTTRWSIAAPRSATTRKCAATCCTRPKLRERSRRSSASSAASSTASC